jgi:olefin beta-lactone synthetase
MATVSSKPAGTIASAFAALAQSHPGRLALAIARQGGRRYEEVSLAELERDANTFAEIYGHHGMRRGMRTVVMITPGREFCAAVFGLLKLGAPPVFIDPGMGLRNVGKCFR